MTLSTLSFVPDAHIAKQSMRRSQESTNSFAQTAKRYFATFAIKESTQACNTTRRQRALATMSLTTLVICERRLRSLLLG